MRTRWRYRRGGCPKTEQRGALRRETFDESMRLVPGSVGFDVGLVVGGAKHIAWSRVFEASTQALGAPTCCGEWPDRPFCLVHARFLG